MFARCSLVVRVTNQFPLQLGLGSGVASSLPLPSDLFRHGVRRVSSAPGAPHWMWVRSHMAAEGCKVVSHICLVLRAVCSRLAVGDVTKFGHRLNEFLCQRCIDWGGNLVPAAAPVAVEVASSSSVAAAPRVDLYFLRS